MEICAVIFLYYLAIDADTNKKKKVCKQIMGKFSDLEDLIKKRNRTAVQWVRFRRLFLSFTLNFRHGFQVVRRFGISVG